MYLLCSDIVNKLLSLSHPSLTPTRHASTAHRCQIRRATFQQAYCLFRECCSRCRFQPYHCVIIRFVEYIQTAFEFCCRQCGCWPQSQWLGETQSVQVSTTSWPVRKQFIYRDRIWRWRRSKPGCRIVGSVAIVWLTTEADDQSSLRCVIVSTDVNSGRDASRGRGSKPPRTMWQGTP